MNTDAMVLRALLRLARRREAASEEALVLRVGVEGSTIRASLRRLDRLGMVESGEIPRLTMSGLALSLALIAPKAPARLVHRSTRTSRTSRAA
jgi:hypothetical protein